MDDTARSPDPAAPIVWRRLDPNLWVGRRGDRHIGSIEHSHGYVFIDADGGASAGHRTLVAAQATGAGEAYCAVGAERHRFVVPGPALVAVLVLSATATEVLCGAVLVRVP